MNTVQKGAGDRFLEVVLRALYPTAVMIHVCFSAPTVCRTVYKCFGGDVTVVRLLGTVFHNKFIYFREDDNWPFSRTSFTYVTTRLFECNYSSRDYLQ